MSDQALRSLQKYTKKPTPAPGLARLERCELCSELLASSHQHLMNPESRELICTCDGCAVLFDSTGLTKYRRVPRNVRILPDFRLTGKEWEKLLVPIQLAFLYRSTHAGRVIALYPSPAGVTEAEIDQKAWDETVADNPVLKELQDDVQALLVNRLKGQREYFLCPMDRCFELVGLIRKNWRGFTGGDQVWSVVQTFLTQLKEGARP